MGDDNTIIGDRLASFKYIHVHGLPQKKGRKTRDFAVFTRSGVGLGLIKFYSAWRQHVLAPAPDTLWSKGCLADVNEFIEGIGSKWK